MRGRVEFPKSATSIASKVKGSLTQKNPADERY
jgi:hypothetical protein